MTATAVDDVVLDVLDVLVELLERGYSLSVETRVHVHDHKDGPHPVTYADRLLVVGDELVADDHLREAIVANKPLFLAAACVLNPPTTAPWLRLLVDRCARGAVFTVSGVEYLASARVLAANVAAFVGLDPIGDAHMIEPIVRSALAPMVVQYFEGKADCDTLAGAAATHYRDGGRWKDYREPTVRALTVLEEEEE